jgi:hypothetical protein
VDNEDELKVLVGYKKCFVDRFKKIEEDRKQAKLNLKDKLLTELSIRYFDHIENQVSSSDVTNDELIYDICGYLLHSRSEVLECCKCKSLLKTEESAFTLDPLHLYRPSYIVNPDFLLADV